MQRSLVRALVSSSRIQKRFAAPKGKVGAGAGPFDDRIVSAVVPGKKFMLHVISDVETINNRVGSLAVTMVFVGGVLVYWPIQPVWSVFTLFLLMMSFVWLYVHVVRMWVFAPLIAFLLYKFLF
eukprot:RCo047857